MKKLLFLLIILIFIFIETFSQDLSIIGNEDIDVYFSLLSGDLSLSYLSPDIKSGIYFLRNSNLHLNYFKQNLSLEYNYTSDPSEKIHVSLKISDIEISFGNFIDLSHSPLTIYNKSIDGIYGNYENKNLSTKCILGKIEAIKKLKKFYGNNTQGPYKIEDTNLVPYKEKVYLNNNFLNREIDYTIDYIHGILYFTNIISPEDEISIEYELLKDDLFYNLYGVFLEYNPINFSFLSLNEPKSGITTNYMEGGLKIYKDEYNFLDIRRAISFNNEYHYGYADSINYSLNFNFMNSSFQYLNSKNYAYMPEILGNYDLGINSQKIFFSFNLYPTPLIKYSFHYLFQKNLNIENNKQYHELLINTKNSKTCFIHKTENDKATKEINYSYNPISLNYSYQENVSKTHVSNTYSLTLSPQIGPFQPYITFQNKDYILEEGYLKEYVYSGGVKIKIDNREINAGEISTKIDNLNPQIPFEINQIYMTDGINYSFYLSYKPIENTIKIYINNSYVENNSTFTYFLPNGTYKTYTINIRILENRVDILFIDETKIIPPPPDLSITITYKSILPINSYTKIRNLEIKSYTSKTTTSLCWQKIDKDYALDYILNLSISGFLFPNTWINFNGSKQFYDKKDILSLNLTYYFLPSSLNIDTKLIKTNESRFTNLRLNAILNFKNTILNMFWELLENIYQDNYNKNISYGLEMIKSLNSGELKISLYNTKKDETSPSQELYKTNSEKIVFIRNLSKTKLEVSINHDKFNNNADKYSFSLIFYNQKFNINNNFYLKYIYHTQNDTYLEIWQFGFKNSLCF